jgi:hypothetical protein
MFSRIYNEVQYARAAWLIAKGRSCLPFLVLWFLVALVFLFLVTQIASYL